MNYKGFTLIELLAVVLILGILTSVAVPQYRRSLERSRAAEPVQMLPAIFDSRERLITERDLDWEALRNDEEYRRKEAPFSRLDIELKGQLKDDSEPTLWMTSNFFYFLFDRDDPNMVSAEPINRYGGTRIFYDGRCMICKYEGGDPKNNGCEIFNIEDCDLR